ncbi:hypothetical protein REZ80_003125 [Klebsiella aerogenes]|uniref:hypothetical protein n=1 Tax=Klebsiella aerogenes TaxID=548 RepID=UPI0012DC7AC3|nr:hypothetical protein [Klebsiella aerogenes]EKZ6150133.1 hypothetical protein [Klebsiella aerogenes]EKZ6287121.1 hypothetical protein [Klebsiella aerogenes]HCW3467132.1 hypothetical protein [Klebsiella aerogenes]
MNWFDAKKIIDLGGKIYSSRLPEGSYVTASNKAEGGFKLVQSDGTSEAWRPAGSDQLSDNWQAQEY